MPLALALVAALAALAVYARLREPEPGAGGPVADLAAGAADLLGGAVGVVESAGEQLMAAIQSGAEAVRRGFQLPERAAPYVDAINAAEARNGLPQGLLGRVLYQESRFRPDIISGQVKSSAGAVGIAQIVPKWHPGVDPTDPYASIDYAGGYLRQLFDRFGDWPTALAAYNWGQGNVARKGTANLPAETEAYVRDITRDVGLST